VQTLVPLMLDQVKPAIVTGALRRSHQRGPARLYKHRHQGRIAAGYDADFTVVDLKRTRPSPTNGGSRAGWTPYDGMRVTGWPVGTFVRGRRVMCRGAGHAVDRRASAVPGDAEGVSNRAPGEGRELLQVRPSSPA